MRTMTSGFFLASCLVLGSLVAAGPAHGQSASLDSALAAAKHWATLADARSVERMWSSSGQLMRQAFTQDAWGKYLGSVQGEFGGVNKRDWVQMVRISNPGNLPAGEYVNIVFASRFSKAMVIEKISLVQDGSSWVPVGYVVANAEQVAQAAPATVGAAQAAK